MPPALPQQSIRLRYENEDTERLAEFQSKGYRTVPILFVNGARVSDQLARQARPNQTLLSFLRDVLRLTGSKLGCAEGGCGACTVMISKKAENTTTIQHASVNACLMPVLAADGCHVTTVEGIGTVKNDNLHPIQQAMVDMHGSQCGFCTPGIIVSIYTLLANDNNASHLEEHLDGNLCRCTGYRPIWDAARALCTDGADVVKGPCGTPCRECPERDTCEQDCNVESKQAACCSSSSHDKMSAYRETFLADAAWREQPNQMFPQALLEASSPEVAQLAKPLVVVDNSEFQAAGTWFAPKSLADLLTLLNEYDNCKIVVGNTEVGIEAKFKHSVFPRLIAPSESIVELFGVEQTNDALLIGSCCPLSTIQHECQTIAADSGGGSSSGLQRIAQPIHDMLRWFASTQIRNVACLGGNLVTASPISDMNPLLASMGAELILASLQADGTIARRTVAVANFFLKYRTVDLQSNEILERVKVPLVQEQFEYVIPFKQARRREDDISIVTSGMRVKVALEGDKIIVKEASLAFGGMAPTTVLAAQTAASLVGSEFSEATFEAAMKVLVKELALPEAVPGGQAAYRMTLALSFLKKFYLSVTDELRGDLEKAGSTISLESSEAKIENFVRQPKPSAYGVQTYPAPKVASGLETKVLPRVKSSKAAAEAIAVGSAATHQSGPLHCTGEALYCDDIPLPPGTLQAALVLAEEAGGIFQSMDIAPALEVPGVAGVFSYEDVLKLGGSNEMGPIVHDETVFLPPGEKVQMVGQVLAIVVAETLEGAELGARSVNVTLSAPESKAIVTVDDAIEAGSFYDFSRHSMERGETAVLDALEATSGPTVKTDDLITVSGTFRSGAQDHFYLETNASLVVPSESDTNLTVYASTQAVTKTQNFCASSTGTPASKVTVRVKRMGGGFGGKETRSVFASCAAAVAAKRTSRPVRITLSRADDMKLTGTRHAFVSTYHASARLTDDGAKLVSCSIKIYANGGSGFDLSGPVVDRALFHCDGCYYYPNFRAEGVPCKTVQAPHTAFRGFGGPQGMAVAEHIMEHLSVSSGEPVEKLRRMNMYKTGEATPYGMVMDEVHSGKWNVPSMWDKLEQEADVVSRRKSITEFNAKSKYVKRGLAMIPTRFGIAFTAKYMNQGGALVHLYTDGTVLVSHGGTEMGQGLHTKVCQVAAQAFGIPIEDVYVSDTSSDKVANTVPTAASMSTDLYGMATLDACRQILKRLEPIREKLGAGESLEAVAKAAFFERIDLSAHGFFALDNSRCGFDWNKDKPEGFPEDAPANSWKGNPFNYFTQGVVCTEVQIDCLSGDHRTVRTDMLVDVGSSINPAIDIGQIEGAFVQGMGWSTIEDVVYADNEHIWIRPRGSLFTTGPGTYKIPAFNDVPEVFNVSLVDDVDNPFAVHSSKAIGEPPFFLGSSVFYAIKDAVSAARKQNTNDEYFEMRMPATSERIRMQCADSIAEIASESLGKSCESFQPAGSY